MIIFELSCVYLISDNFFPQFEKVRTNSFQYCRNANSDSSWHVDNHQKAPCHVRCMDHSCSMECNELDPANLVNITNIQDFIVEATVYETFASRKFVATMKHDQRKFKSFCETCASFFCFVISRLSGWWTLPSRCFYVSQSTSSHG